MQRGRSHLANVLHLRSGKTNLLLEFQLSDYWVDHYEKNEGS
jgi:hypothetical protein